MRSSTRHGKLPLAATAAVALLAVLASTALALQSHPRTQDLDAVPGGSFYYQGLAVDQSGGDIYAVDQYDPNTFAHGFIHRFGSDGSYDAAFGTATATFSETLSEPQDVAVDNSGTASDGTVYVADSGHNQVDALDSTGALIASFGDTEPTSDGRLTGADTPPGGFAYPSAVAVDPTNGNLFVADQGNSRVWIFDSTGAYLGRVSDSLLKSPSGLAFSPAGEYLFVQNNDDGKVLIFVRQSATEFDGETLYSPDNGTPADSSDDGPSATDVAVDPADGHIFIDKGDRITEYDAGALPVLTFGQGELNSSAGIAVSAATAYVSSGVSSDSRIATFGPLTTLADVTTGDPTNVTDTAVTVTGTLDPAGVETTECFFEWGEDPQLGNTTPCAEGDAFTDPAQVSMEKTRAELSLPFFYYRLAVANANGTARGEIKQASLLQQPPASFVTAVTTTQATLHAELDPRGVAAAYHFEYVDDATFNASGFAEALSAPVPDATTPVANSRITVDQPLSGLSPDTRYHYRVLADLGGTPYESTERAFKTDGIVPEIPAAQFPGQGFLPDGRAWEMVTPPDKNGSTATAFDPKTIVAPDGNRVAYAAPIAAGDVQGTGVAGNTQYVATRGAGGWSSHAVTPKTDPSWSQIFSATTLAYFNPLVTRAVVRAYDLPQIAGDVVESPNLYRENLDGPADLAALTKESEPLPFLQERLLEDQLVGGDQDFDRIFIASFKRLLPEATPLRRNIYEWDGGTLRIAGVLPDGSIPAGGSEPVISTPGDNAAENSTVHDAVSTDGSRLLFLASLGGPNQQLLMRKDHTSTTWVSQAEGSTPVSEAESVKFQAATPDLHKVAFTTTSQLTDEDPGSVGEALYIYTDSPDPENEPGNLEFIYRSSSVAVSPATSVTVDGISEDGERGFFYAEDAASKGTLFHWDTQGVQAVTGVQVSLDPRSALAPNTAVHSGYSGVRTTGDGRTIAFLYEQKLTAADLGFRNLANSERFPALYVYSADTDELVCASCPPSGEATSGATMTYPGAPEDGGVGFTVGRNTFLTADGARVFFSTPDPLVPEDTNGRYDAYEYEVEAGQAHLLSSGHSSKDSWFASASPSGDDAFIITFEALSAHDVDNAKDMYDARVGGGLPEPLPAPARCEGDACQPAPLGLNDPTPSSEAFAGAGNPKPRAKAKKKHGRHHKRQRAKHHQQRANVNRRTSK